MNKFIIKNIDVDTLLIFNYCLTETLEYVDNADDFHARSGADLMTAKQTLEEIHKELDSRSIDDDGGFK